MSGPIFFIPEVTKWDHVQQKAKIVITENHNKEVIIHLLHILSIYYIIYLFIT